MAMFSQQHAKTLIIDKKLVISGSVNMTHNGHENNKEHQFRITEPKAVSEVCADFEECWEKAQVVTEEIMEAKYEQYKLREENKNERKQYVRPSPTKSLEETFASLAVEDVQSRSSTDQGPSARN